MPPRLDSNVPPHKTKPFWYLVALAIVLGVVYSLASPSHGRVWQDIVPSVILSIVLVCMGWFAVRRMQRSPATPSTLRVVVLIIFGIILFILDRIFKLNLW